MEKLLTLARGIFVFDESESFIQYSEDFNEAKISIKVGFLKVKPAPSLELIEEFLAYGRIGLNLKTPDMEILDTIVDPQKYDEIIDQLSFDYEDNDEYLMSIVVYKNTSLNSCYVFDMSAFAGYLQSLDDRSLLSSFEKWIDGRDLLTFIDLQSDASLLTPAICFQSRTSSISVDNVDYLSLRKDILEKSGYVCNYESGYRKRLVSSDFKVLFSKGNLFGVNDIIHKLGALLCISELADFTSFSNGLMSCRINGYKSINLVVASEMIAEDSISELHDIVGWVYRGGSVSDKIGLARNIITLQLINNSTLAFSGSPFLSIRSSFEIYLRQNIKQYIELKGKLNEQLSEATSRASRLADEYASAFRKSIMPLVSLFGTMIIGKFVLSKEIKNLFNREVTLLSLTFIAVAIIYHIFTLFEVGKDTQAIRKSYNQIKTKYSDILVQDDIARILGNDTYFDSHMEDISGKILRFSVAWSFVILLFIAVICVLSSGF